MDTLTGSDADLNTLSFSIVSAPQNGVIDSLNSSTGDYAYTPNENYFGVDSFTFRVNDGAADSTAATVSIMVNAVDDAPVAINETVRVSSNGSVSTFVRGEDVDGDTLSYALLSSPKVGLISGFNTSTGAFSYAPGEFEGSTSFQFSVGDGNSPPVQGTINLIVDASPSVSLNSSLASSQAPGTTITFTALANNSGDYQYEFWLKGPATGDAWQRVRGFSTLNTWSWVTTNADLGVSTIWVYSRLVDSNEIYARGSSEFLIDDGNQAPVPTSLTLDVQVDMQRESTLTATDADGDDLTFSIVSGPANGTLTFFDSDTGVFVYMPNSGFTGNDSFVYRVTDTALSTATQTLSITVSSANNVPVALDGVLTATSGVLSSGILAGSDDDGDSLTYAIVTGTAKGVLSDLNSSTGHFNYLANEDYEGTDRFTFSVDDGTAVDYGIIDITVVAATGAVVNTNLASPQTAGASIDVQASVSELTNPEYEFWLKGPATGGAWSRVQAYSSSSVWSWNTSSSDVGTSTIWMYSREAGATTVHESATLEFVIE